jgi:hypothetical protein
MEAVKKTNTIEKNELNTISQYHLEIVLMLFDEDLIRINIDYYQKLMTVLLNDNNQMVMNHFVDDNFENILKYLMVVVRVLNIEYD